MTILLSVVDAASVEEATGARTWSRP